MSIEQGTYEGWNYKKVQKVLQLPNGDAKTVNEWFFSRKVTHTGSAQTVSLPLSFKGGIKVNRISQFWNDTTAKDFNIRIYAGSDGATYDIIESQTTDQTQSYVDVLGDAFVYLTAWKIDFVFANTTNGKTDDIMIQLEEF